ncbi:MAG: SDR family NAD(P)-dependent oxidoreductase [Arcicella sp.]|nr:SDR family NAD(P)-dependent oxidoreductase [Arcicella sp.]
MKISILGCGWLGLPLGKFLVEKGHTVKGSTTSEEKIPLLSNVGIEPFLIKFSPEIETVNQVSEHGQGLPWYVEQFLDSELLIICIPPRAGKFGEDFHVQQIQSLIENLEGSSIKSIIYTSSTSVYPELNREMREDDKVLENHALIKVENLLKSLPQNITILRCGGLMGKERIPAKYFAGKTINTGQIPVNYIHQDDAIQIIAMILEKGFWNETFNVVSPEHPVREKVYLKNCEDLGFQKPIFEESTEPTPYKIISPQKLILRTGYVFKYGNPLDFGYSTPSPIQKL